MKISNSKKHLARIISENGGWRDGAEWAAQDKSYCSRKNNVVLYKSKPPKPQVGESCWGGLPGEMLVELEAGELVRNWHQTILSRAEYFHLYPEPDADGWIEWKGGAANPVKFGELVDVKLANGEALNRVSANSGAEWRHCWGDTNIIAYRLHKPVQSGATDKLSSEAVSAAKIALMSDSIEELVRKPTIEQLAADYRSAKDYAERKQQEVDAAKADAEARLKALEIAGEALGLLVSPITAKQEPELAITDWRDLQTGDLVWVEEEGGRVAEGEYEVLEVEVPDYDGKRAIRIRGGEGGQFWINYENGWRFIRRP